jgi:hypothetical protein
MDKLKLATSALRSGDVERVDFETLTYPEIKKIKRELEGDLAQKKLELSKVRFCHAEWKEREKELKQWGKVLTILNSHLSASREASITAKEERQKQKNKDYLVMDAMFFKAAAHEILSHNQISKIYSRVNELKVERKAKGGGVEEVKS